MGTLNDNIAEYLSKTNSVATTYFVWGNIGGLYPSWAWGTLLCSTDNTANFIGIANGDKTAAFAHYENGTWEKVPVESLSNLTTTNKSSLVDAINEVNGKRFFTENIGDTTADNHAKIDRDIDFEAISWINSDYDKTFGNQWCFVKSMRIDQAGYAFQFIISCQLKTTVASRYCDKGTWGKWSIIS